MSSLTGLDEIRSVVSTNIVSLRDPAGYYDNPKQTFVGSLCLAIVLEDITALPHCIGLTPNERVISGEIFF